MAFFYLFPAPRNSGRSILKMVVIEGIAFPNTSEVSPGLAPEKMAFWHFRAAPRIITGD